MKFSGHIIGVDESGKGDFFGPLVVAALLAGQDDLSFLAELGVRDSKRISDGRILFIDERLRARFPHRAVVLMPPEYNRRYDELRNLNVLLARCHVEAISGVLAECKKQKRPVDRAISDRFGKTERLETALAEQNCHLPVKQLVRGETVPQVAAASIVARAEFIRRMDRLSVKYAMTLPKGASAQVDAVGRRLVREHGIEVLGESAKLHFKNYRRSLAKDLLS